MAHIAESNTTVLENLEASARVARNFTRRDEKPTPYVGLCRNCDVRETCLYRNPETIVWFCEEYK
jgi:hypothetical protein